MSNVRAPRPRLLRLAERLGQAAALDGPSVAVARGLRSAVPRGAVKDALSGTPLGHALHPLLTDVPIGIGCRHRCSTSSAAAPGGRRRDG